MTTTLTRTATRTTSCADLADAVARRAAEMQPMLDTEHLVSQDRCVDELLDMMNATSNGAVTRVIFEILDEIHAVSAVRGDELAGYYSLLGAVATVEGALELSETEPA